MGPCISKKKQSSSNPPNQDPKVPSEQAPARAPPSSQPQAESLPDLKFLFKPISDTSKAYLYNVKSPSVYQVPTSLPFKFKKSCSVALLENEEFLISGGYDEDGEMSNKTMIFYLSTLSGRLMEDCPCNFVSGSLLYYSRKKAVFLAGGLQNRQNDSNFSEICDYIGAEFCMFDLAKQKWEVLDPPPKQYSLSTCFLKENQIYLCGGFSSLVDETKFILKTQVFIYDILKYQWLPVNFDYQIQTVGSIAVNIESNILILGGWSEVNVNSSKVFLLANMKQVNNLKDFQSPNLTVVAPEYHLGARVLFLADPDMLITYDVKTGQVTNESLINLKKPQNEYFSLNSVSNPRAAGIYTYMPECGHKLLKDFNVISQDTFSHPLKTIQFRDAGMAVMNDGNIFFAGGVGTISSKSTSMCFVFNPITGEEREETSLPVSIRGVRLVESNGTIFAIGGYNEGNEREVISFSYIVSTKEWRKVNNLMQLLRSPTCFIINKSLFAIGGETIDESGCESLSDCVQAMDLEQQVWSEKMIKYPHQAKSMGIIQISKSSVLIFGGEDNDGNSLNTCYVFDGEEFKETGNLPDSCSTFNFETTGVLYNRKGFIFTMAGVLLKVDLDNEYMWEEVNTEQEFTNRI
jgi:N-acetylneuraminic acid mutarotase